MQLIYIFLTVIFSRFILLYVVAVIQIIVPFKFIPTIIYLYYTKLTSNIWMKLTISMTSVCDLILAQAIEEFTRKLIIIAIDKCQPF